MALNVTLTFMKQHIVAETTNRHLTAGQRMVLLRADEEGIMKSGAKSVGIVNHGEQTADNNAIRQELLDACKRQFGVTKFANLPECVRKAFKVNAVKDDLKLQTDASGKEIVMSGRPLTARRIQRVIAAVEQALPTLLSAEQRDAVSQKLGIELDAKQQAMLLTSYNRALASDNLPYLKLRHIQQTKNLMAFLTDGHFKNCVLVGSDEIELKDTLAIIRKVPKNKRADALALALTVGTEAMAKAFASRSVCDEVLASKPKGGVIDAPLLKKWADKKVATFNKRYPNCPDFYYKEETSDLLEKAAGMGFLMKVENHKRQDLATAGDNDSYKINFAAWKRGSDINDNGEESIGSLLDSSDVLSQVRNLSREYDEDSLLKLWSPTGPVLKMECIPPGTQPQDLLLLKDAKEQVVKDLPRTHITATMVKSGGETIEIDAKCPKDDADAAEMKAREIYDSIKSYLGIEKLTPQAKVVFGMFTQWGMPIRSEPGIEHFARQIAITRDGDDVLVQVTNSNDENDDKEIKVHFDFTIRIAPDGSNEFVALDVHPKNMQNEAPLPKRP